MKKQDLLNKLIREEIRKALNEDQSDAVQELRDITDQIEELAENARELIRQHFPDELSRMDAYGAFNMIYSANRYDVTLGKLIDELEEGKY